MNMNDKVYKSLISKKIKLRNHTAIPQSPVTTHLVKWTGKKFKIPIERGNVMDLTHSPWAQLLGSPLRGDRLSRVQLPSGLLIRSHYDGENVSLSYRDLDQPQLRIERANSYVVNSQAFIRQQAKKPVVMLPLHVISNKYMPKKVDNWDPERLLTDLEQNLCTEISQLLDSENIGKLANARFRIVDGPKTDPLFKMLPQNKGTSVQINLGRIEHKAVAFLKHKIANSSTKSLESNNPRLAVKMYRLVCFLQ